MTEENTPMGPDDDDIVTPDDTAIMEAVPTDERDATPSLAKDGAVIGTSEAASRRTILWTIVVVAVVALIVGLAYATARDDKTRGTGDSTDLEGSHQGTSTVDSIPSATATRTPGSTRTPSPTMPGQTPSSRPGAKAPSAPPVERTTEPAPEGSKLTTITQPPEATLAMIEPAKLNDDARYTIVFSPYGYGPSRGGQPSLVVRITQATPTNESAKALDFTDRNLLATARTGSDPIKLGGTYTGVLTFRPEGGLLVPVIGEVKPKE